MRKISILMVLLTSLLLISTAGNVWAGQMEKIDINKASEKELTQLERVGPATAKKIVKYRDEHGPFKAPQDIMKVSGIGTKTFEMNKDRITVPKPEKKEQD